LISKDALIDAVWDGRAVTDGAVGKCIEELRAVFGEDGRHYLRNIRGRGYIFDREPQHDSFTIRETRSEEANMFRVIVEEENRQSQIGVPNLDTHPLSSTRSLWPSTTATVMAACVLVLSVVGGYWLYRPKQPSA
jgi:DNA-binding winged helix-turn-helix (wHTH) protein